MAKEIKRKAKGFGVPESVPCRVCGALNTVMVTHKHVDPEDTIDGLEREIDGYICQECQAEGKVITIYDDLNLAKWLAEWKGRR